MQANFLFGENVSNSTVTMKCSKDPFFYGTGYAELSGSSLMMTLMMMTMMTSTHETALLGFEKKNLSRKKCITNGGVACTEHDLESLHTN